MNKNYVGSPIKCRSRQSEYSGRRLNGRRGLNKTCWNQLKSSKCFVLSEIKGSRPKPQKVTLCSGKTFAVFLSFYDASRHFGCLRLGKVVVYVTGLYAVQFGKITE